MDETEVLFFSLLRVLTPEEINELTTSFTENTKVALSDIVTEYIAEQVPSEKKDEGAKILPFTKEEAPVEEVLNYVCGRSVSDILENFALEARQAEKNIFGTKRLPKKIRGTYKETSKFILEEKEKFKQSIRLIKSKEIVDLYKKNLSVDIEHQKNTKDDLSKNPEMGVLVNKKQA